MTRKTKKWLSVGVLGLVLIVIALAYGSPFSVFCMLGVTLSIVAGFGLLSCLKGLNQLNTEECEIEEI